MKKELAPVHPGEILQKGFLEPMGISQNKLALARIEKEIQPMSATG